MKEALICVERVRFYELRRLKGWKEEQREEGEEDVKERNTEREKKRRKNSMLAIQSVRERASVRKPMTVGAPISSTLRKLTYKEIELVPLRLSHWSPRRTMTSVIVKNIHWSQGHASSSDLFPRPSCIASVRFRRFRSRFGQHLLMMPTPTLPSLPRLPSRRSFRRS